MTRLWPGPLTLIAGEAEPVGLRMPDCRPLLELLKRSGPLASTSANMSGGPSCNRLDEIAAGVLEEVDAVVVDAPEGALDRPSTILSFSREKGWQVVREGSLPPEKYRKWI